MALNMRTLEEWIAESNARNEEELGQIAQEMQDVCASVDESTLIYTKNVFCFGKKAEVLFFFQDHVLIGNSNEDHIEIRKLKYHNIATVKLQTNAKNTTLHLAFSNGSSILLDSLNDNCGAKNWLFARQIKSIFQLV